MSDPIMRAYFRLTRSFGLHALAGRPRYVPAHLRIYRPKSGESPFGTFANALTRFLYTRPSKKLLKRGRYAVR
jgi:hypothetical protein